jgi:integrase
MKPLKKMGRPRADASWPKPFGDTSYKMDKLERWALGAAIKEAGGGPVEIQAIVDRDAAGWFDNQKTRISFLTYLIAALQKVGGFDVRPLAMRLAQVRAEQNARNALARPQEEKKDLLEDIPGWPAIYAAHWRARIGVVGQTLRDKLAAKRAGVDTKAKKSERSSLINTRSAFNRFIAFCRSKGWEIETDAALCALWLDDLLREGVTHSSCASYVSRVGNLVGLVEKIDTDKNWWLHTATCLREEAERDGVQLEEPKHPAELAHEGIKLIRKARRALRTGERLPQDCARLFRDGLIVVLLALYPLRRHNCAPLEFGNNLKKVGDSWYIDLPPDQTKEANRIKFRLAPWLVCAMIEWRKSWQKMLSHGETNFLFSTHVGETLSMARLTTIVKDRTGSTCHGFRHAAATMIAEETDREADATHVLGHKDSRTRILYSRTAECLRAGETLAMEIARVQKRLAIAA